MSVERLLTEEGPVRVVCGSDRFGVESYVESAVETFRSGAFADMNVERFYGDEVEASRIEDACQSMPAFAAGRLVVWRAHSAAQGSKMLGKMLDYCKNPNPTTLLLLVLAGDPDGRLKATKYLKKAGYVRSFEPLNERSAALWLARFAMDRGIDLGADLATAVVSAAGCDRAELAQALEKLDLFASGAPIDRGMIDAVVSTVLDEDVWALADLLAHGALGPSLELLGRLLDDQHSGHQLLPGLSYRFRSLARFVGAREAKVPRNAIARQAGVSPRDQSRSAPLIRRWNGQRMGRALAAFGRAEDRLKGGWGAGERATMEALCVEVCAL